MRCNLQVRSLIRTDRAVVQIQCGPQTGHNGKLADITFNRDVEVDKTYEVDLKLSGLPTLAQSCGSAMIVGDNKVWILSEVDYESNTLLGAYESDELAIEAARKFWPRQKLNFRPVDHGHEDALTSYNGDMPCLHITPLGLNAPVK